ncbi:MAG: prepilin-type N-terminal cleavage/methylation domain-containing protein [Parcubacteria group bacterium]|jgi:prepilin-type N-terminal cleavage/methylation domain-containing protein
MMTSKKIQNKKKKVVVHQGFSLIEMLVAMLIFVIMTLVIMGTFFDMIKSRARVRAIQQDVEDARYGMELMVKTLRMSSVFSANGSQNSIIFYDYSRKGCFQYRKDSTPGSKSILVDIGADPTKVTDPLDQSVSVVNCGSNWDSSKTGKLVNGTADELYFDVKKSVKDTSLGHVTIAMRICDKGDCMDSNDSATIQSSVSLRDYGLVNGY